MKKVLLAAPSHDGNVSVWHASALSETCKLGLTKGVNVIAIYMSFDSLVQRARNDIVQLMLEHDFDDLVFIDTDQDWKPEDFFKLLSYDADVVAAPVPKKSDVEQYNVKLLGEYKVLDNGLVEVDGVGTGMMRISRQALQQVWDASPEYQEPHKEKTCRMVFNVEVVDGVLVSEDIVFSNRWKSLGGKIYIDPSIDCAHSGHKRWTGNFSSWIERVKGAR